MILTIVLSAVLATAAQNEPPANHMSWQDFYDLVTFLEESREALIAENVPVPLLTAILDGVREKMTQDGLKVNDTIFDALKREFEAFEAEDQTQLQPPELK